MSEDTESRSVVLAAEIEITALSRVRRLPDTWTGADLRRLLELLEFDDWAEVAESDLLEMVAMGLQDLDADDAATLVLENFCDGRFNPGQVQNLCAELREDRAWEEYPDIRHHRALYLCVDILSEAFPLDFPRPSATRLEFHIRAAGIGAAHAASPLDAATAVRAIARSQSEELVVRRFFASQIAGGAFPEADAVVWHMTVRVLDAGALAVTLHGSSYWFANVDDDTVGRCRLQWPEPPRRQHQGHD